jgi:uncharacterized protein YdiU (UPF0061 family)
MQSLESLAFDNSYRRLPDTLYSSVQPTGFKNPFLVSFNTAAAALLDLNPAEAGRAEFAAYFGGQRLLPGSDPIAMKYTGHQFGGYNPDLGDGRGLLLGEVVNGRGERWDLHLKGAGQTPYSRFGDGRAVLRSSIREYLCSEAMHHLGIPTTRALCIIGSDEPVQREKVERGAMILRLADTHVRFGHFEWLGHSNQYELLRELADYVIARSFPEFVGHAKPYEAFFGEVVRRTARLMAQWQLVGFAHGVMNTDNFSITGATFDYGPYGFLDAYEPGYICNHTDHQGRYAWNRQPTIGLWNLNALAHALSPLIEHEALVAILQQYEPVLLETYAEGFHRKLGLQTMRPEDQPLTIDLLDLLMKNQVDYTRFFRALSHQPQSSEPSPLRDDFLDREGFDSWHQRYRQRLLAEASVDAERQALMLAANPKYILRNYLAQTAIEKAEAGDYSEVDRLLALLQKPFDEQPDMERYAAPPPDWGRHMEISCSS